MGWRSKIVLQESLLQCLLLVRVLGPFQFFVLIGESLFVQRFPGCDETHSSFQNGLLLYSPPRQVNSSQWGEKVGFHDEKYFYNPHI